MIHENAVRHEEGITFYTLIRMLHQEAMSALFPTTNEIDMYTIKGEMIQAMSSLVMGGFVAGSISSGALSLRVTLKGACWLLIAQPLLKLEERASQLTTNPETLEAIRLLINAYSESQISAAGSIYLAIDNLQHASGGESGFIHLLGQPNTYVKDLKHSMQPNRHAEPWGQIKLTHQQCLERATEIIDKYITLLEQRSNLVCKEV